MKNTYKVTGMTCNSCKASVIDALQKVEFVKNVEIDLETSKAIINSSEEVSIKVLKEALSSKYSIEEVVNNLELEDDKEQSKIKQLYPLFLIFAYIIMASILLNINPWNTNAFMLDFMGLFYIVFSFFKFLDLKGFPQSFRMYDPLAKAIPVYGWIYPFIELALGVFFLMRIEITTALVITLIILGITTIGVTKSLLNKNSIQCACLGTALKLPMTTATFIENSIMLIMAIIMLFGN